MGGVQSAAAGCGGSFELVGMIIIIVCVFFKVIKMIMKQLLLFMQFLVVG